MKPLFTPARRNPSSIKSKRKSVAQRSSVSSDQQPQTPETPLPPPLPQQELPRATPNQQETREGKLNNPKLSPEKLQRWLKEKGKLESHQKRFSLGLPLR